MTMTLDELWQTALEHFPACHITEDTDGEIMISTGLMWEAPLGYAGVGPQNVPLHARGNVELRKINEGDLPNVDS